MCVYSEGAEGNGQNFHEVLNLRVVGGRGVIYEEQKSFIIVFCHLVLTGLLQLIANSSNAA